MVFERIFGGKKSGSSDSAEPGTVSRLSAFWGGQKGSPITLQKTVCGAVAVVDNASHGMVAAGGRRFVELQLQTGLLNSEFFVHSAAEAITAPTTWRVAGVGVIDAVAGIVFAEPKGKESVRGALLRNAPGAAVAIFSGATIPYAIYKVANHVIGFGREYAHAPESAHFVSPSLVADAKAKARTVLDGITGCPRRCRSATATAAATVAQKVDKEAANKAS